MKHARQIGFRWLWVTAAAISLAACGERMESGQAPNDQAPSRMSQGQSPQPDRPADPAREPGATAGGNAAPEAGATGATAAADPALGDAVKSQLARDPQLGAAPIEVEVAQGGQVALKGTAPTASARERAAQLAWTVKGVTKVDNQLTVRGS